ncbi:MAG: hypothetical protein M1830_009742 [Pleopsidium flavum]|nr:MAG: hypothetical protein M1830_009742 [Pleopsidium flavum]
MRGLKRKLEGNASTATNSSDTDSNAIANANGSLNPPPLPPKRKCREQSVPFQIVTRRSASAAASAQNSLVSSAVNSDAEASRRSSIQYGNSNTEDTKLGKGPGLLSKSSRSRSRSSTIVDKPKAKPPKLKLFVAKPSAKTDTALPATSPENKQSSELSTTRLATESNKRKRTASPEEEERDESAGPAGFNNAEHGDALLEVDKEVPSKKRRGRLAKTQKDLPITSAELTPAPEAPNVNIEVPAPSVKRPPGRPRKGRPPVSRQGSEIAVKRPPGRQRVPKSDPKEEANLLRCGHLKSAYRQLVQALKPVLDEITERSLSDIRNDLQAHEKHDQFKPVQAALDDGLAQRLAEIEKEYQSLKGIEEQNWESGQLIWKNECEDRCKEIKEDFITRTKYEYMQHVWSTEAKKDVDGTEDEVELIPRKSSGLGSPVSNTHSSRFYYETERVWDDWNQRLDFQGTLRAVDPRSPRVLPRSFPATDEGRREAALAAENVNMLALASEVVGEQPAAKPPVIPNAQATMLQVLASWAGKEIPAKRPKIPRALFTTLGRNLVHRDEALEQAQRDEVEWLKEKKEEAMKKALDLQQKKQEIPTQTSAAHQQHLRPVRQKRREAPPKAIGTYQQASNSVRQRKQRASVHDLAVHQHNVGPAQQSLQKPSPFTLPAQREDIRPLQQSRQMAQPHSFVGYQHETGHIDQRRQEAQSMNTGFRQREIRPAPPSANQGFELMYSNSPPMQPTQFQAMPFYPTPASTPPFYYPPPPQQQYVIPPPPYYGHPSQGSMGPPPPPPRFTHAVPPRLPRLKMQPTPDVFRASSGI